MELTLVNHVTTTHCRAATLEWKSQRYNHLLRQDWGKQIFIAVAIHYTSSLQPYLYTVTSWYDLRKPRGRQKVARTLPFEAEPDTLLKFWWLDSCSSQQTCMAAVLPLAMINTVAVTIDSTTLTQLVKQTPVCMIWCIIVGVWTDPKGTLEPPKGKVPFGKCLARTLLIIHCV